MRRPSAITSARRLRELRKGALYGFLAICSFAGVVIAFMTGAATGATIPPARSLGVVIPWGSTYLNDLDAFSKEVGAAPRIVGSYRDWTLDLVNASQLDAVIARGATPQITWEPWDPTLGANQPAYALSTITSGAHDVYLQAAAQAAAAYGRPVQIRFAPEMNGSWAPWEGSINGNTPAGYVAAWQHVVSIFRSAGASNVSWVWAPNNGPTSSIAAYYPGDSWVDVMGLDGYNWGSADVWQSFTQVFAPAYSVITSLNATKPVMITEAASAEAGGDKAAWIRSAFLTELPASFPRVSAVIWFDVNKETDWRVDSSSASLAAYQSVATSPLWSGQGATTTTSAATIPAPSLSVSGTGRFTLTFAWQPVVSATGYVLESSTSSAFAPPTDVTTSGSSITVTGLSSGTTYWFRLRAVNAGATSGWSNVVRQATSGRQRK
jgi:hypothetical protein